MKKLCQLIVISLFLSIVNADIIEITGTIVAKRTTSPYPFTTADGRIWECKFKVPYYTQDEVTGEWEWYDYKLYPLRGSGLEFACEDLNVGDTIHFRARRKGSKHRGDLLWYEVL